MSSTPDQFTAAVAAYYEQKASYNQDYNNWLTSQTTSSSSTLNLRPKDNMPAHEAEEHAGGAAGSIFDQVAKDSKDSTASDHEIHDVETGATSGGSQGKATAQDHQGTPGLVKTDDLPEKAGKDELRARAAELNK